MNATTAANLLLIAAVVWVLARQARAADQAATAAGPANPGLRRDPRPAPRAWHVPADLGLLTLSAAVSVGLGADRDEHPPEPRRRPVG